MSVDLLLPSRSLKQKRSVVRPLLAHLRREYAVAAAEAGHLELTGRTQIGVCLTGANGGWPPSHTWSSWWHGGRM